MTNHRAPRPPLPRRLYDLAFTISLCVAVLGGVSVGMIHSLEAPIYTYGRTS